MQASDGCSRITVRSPAWRHASRKAHRPGLRYGAVSPVSSGDSTT